MKRRGLSEPIWAREAETRYRLPPDYSNMQKFNHIVLKYINFSVNDIIYNITYGLFYYFIANSIIVVCIRGGTSYRVSSPVLPGMYA